MRTSNRSHITIRPFNFIGPTYVTPPASETAPDSIESSDHPNGRPSTLQPQPITISLPTHHWPRGPAPGIATRKNCDTEVLLAVS